MVQHNSSVKWYCQKNMSLIFPSQWNLYENTVRRHTHSLLEVKTTSDVYPRSGITVFGATPVPSPFFSPLWISFWASLLWMNQIDLYVLHKNFIDKSFLEVGKQTYISISPFSGNIWITILYFLIEYQKSMHKWSFSKKYILKYTIKLIHYF